jgi:hypothetical protein
MSKIIGRLFKNTTSIAWMKWKRISSMKRFHLLRRNTIHEELLIEEA